MSNNRKLPLKEGVLFKKANKNVYYNTNRMQDEAKLHAKKIIKEAHAQQDYIRRYAYVEGYQQGMGHAINTVLNFLSDKEGQVRKLYFEMEKEIMHFLGDVINDKSVVLQALESWMSAMKFSTEKATLRILAPQKLQSFKPQIIRTIRNVFSGTVIIQYHEQDRFVMSYGDQLAEFDYDYIVTQYAKELLKDRNLRDICNTFSTEGIDSLKSKINHNAVSLNSMLTESDYDINFSKNQPPDCCIE